jgi:hypothetical protein
VDGDGYDDVLVGLPSEGQVVLYAGFEDADADGDGYLASLDCDDTSADTHPGAQEICDPADVDEDCDGMTDNFDDSAIGQQPYYVDTAPRRGPIATTWTHRLSPVPTILRGTSSIWVAMARPRTIPSRTARAALRPAEVLRSSSVYSPWQRV